MRCRPVRSAGRGGAAGAGYPAQAVLAASLITGALELAACALLLLQPLADGAAGCVSRPLGLAERTVFKYDGDGCLYHELATNSSGHPDPGAGRSLTQTLDLPLPSEDSQRADRANLVPPPFELAQASSLVSPGLLPAPRPVLIGQGTHEGITAAGLPLEPIVRLPQPHQ